MSIEEYEAQERAIIEKIVLAECERSAVGEKTGYNLANHRFWIADKNAIRLQWEWEVIRRKMGSKW